jgi:hypothetical protein
MVRVELADGNSSALFTIPDNASVQVRRDADADLSVTSKTRNGEP